MAGLKFPATPTKLASKDKPMPAVQPSKHLTSVAHVESSSQGSGDGTMKKYKKKDTMDEFNKTTIDASINFDSEELDS